MTALTPSVRAAERNAETQSTESHGKMATSGYCWFAGKSLIVVTLVGMSCA